LIESLSEKGICNPSKYSYDALYSDYRRCAIFGYMIASFFLSMMFEYDINNDIIFSDMSYLKEISVNGGGEAMSNLLVDLLIDMREAKLLDDYINSKNPDCLDVK
jgi:hypothetical protein